jgi:hypothetical protein
LKRSADVATILAQVRPRPMPPHAVPAVQQPLETARMKGSVLR